MRALALTAHGGPEVVKLLDLPEPTLQPGGALVRVKAVALNHLDLWVRAGWSNLKLTFPHVQASDVAGVVERVADPSTALRPGGSAVKPGDRVLVQPFVSCGKCPQCAAGRENLCRQFHVRAEGVPGGAADLVAVPVDELTVLPDALSFEQAAAMSLTFLTSWHMLSARAQVAAGEWVLVHAAGSGVGSAAIQLARHLGAHVIATAGDDAKLARAKALGAEHGINYRTQDFVAEVRRLTEKRGVDVVFDSVGGDTFERSLRAVHVGGRVVTCGATSAPMATIDLRVLFLKQLSLLGSTMGTRAELRELVRLAAAGAFHPVIDRVLPVERYEEGERALEDRAVFGKVVLTFD